jgi:ornithine carbamoyltransferase
MARSLLSLAELDDSDVIAIRHEVVRQLKAEGLGRVAGGRVIGLLFTVSSTRTRSAFWRAALDISARVMSFGPGDLQLATGETYRDTGRILANVTDAVVVRTNGPQADMQDLAAFHPAVINAMSQVEHPTQAISDYATIVEQFGSAEGIRLAYFGEGNNTAAALALLFSTVHDAQLRFYMPEGYGLAAGVLEAAKARAARNGAIIRIEHGLGTRPAEADVVYTTRWQTMGVSHADPNWRHAFEGFQVDADRFDRLAGPKTVFMHDLPAVRGDETTADVLDGARSIAWRQAVHKITGARAVLSWCLTTDLA